LATRAAETAARAAETAAWAAETAARAAVLATETANATNTAQIDLIKIAIEATN
jgi:hypothetical protein